MTELKPCPFCGGEAEVLTAESMNGGYLFGVMCNDCRSRGDVYDTEAEAIAAWNIRAERTCRSIDQVDSGEFFICSNCNFGAGRIEFIQNYCPNCGAKVVN